MKTIFKFFFFLTIVKAFIEFVTTLLLLFYVLVFLAARHVGSGIEPAPLLGELRLKFCSGFRDKESRAGL